MAAYFIIIGFSVLGALESAFIAGPTASLLWAVPAGFAVSFLLLTAVYLGFLGVLSLFVKRKEYGCVSAVYKAALDSAYGFIMEISGVRLHVKGMELLPKQEFLLVQNHLSNYDNMLTGVAMRHRRLAFISKPENFKIPIAGRLVWRNLYIPIDRENARNALSSINRAAGIIESGAASVGVYPEGTRSRSGKLGAFKPGSFKAAIKADCPLVITAIRGTEKIKNNIFRRKTDVYLTVLRVIMPEEVKNSRTAELSRIARELIEKAPA